MTAEQMWEAYFKSLIALVVWREASGEGRAGMQGVADVIRNRVLAKHLPDKWATVIEDHRQFSSMTAPGDPQLLKWADKPDSSFEDAMQIAEAVYNGTDEDITGGATMYANLHVCHPNWDFSELAQTVVIGAHTFWRKK